MSQTVISIAQINDYIKSKMDSDSLLSGVSVRGEISNYKVYPSGHHYFTIKDESAALKCVMFRSSAVSLRFQPENGMKIIASGRITVYPRDGAYQLYCSHLTQDGVGDLYAAFEQLKKKLSSQGLFDQEHKKPIPKFPGRIAIITSSAGAAVHDMLRILRKRYPLTQVYLLPVRVQGAEAPGEVSAAIRYANYYKLAELLIVGRGGGSIEDLWAFNDEQVAHAIYESDIPVISAVGHEPDVTISDFVADLRAATPSNGAELAVPDQDSLRQILDAYSGNMASSFTRQLKNARKQLSVIASRPVLKNPRQPLMQRRKDLEMMRRRINSSYNQELNKQRQKYLAYAAKLDALSPLKVLTRGYSVIENCESNIISSVKQIKIGETVKVIISDGELKADIQDIKENEQ